MSFRGWLAVPERGRRSDMDDKLIELEVRVSYQDKLIAELDDVVRAFTKRVEVLERELAALRDTAISPPDPIGGANEPPPHY